jgi:uncharacterized protein DUF4235
VKLLLLPFSIIGGLIAGLFARKVFDQVWGVIDEEEPPEPKHREVDLRKLVAALAIQGAIFRVARGFMDHGTRRAFARLTGTWPGEEAPEPE